MTLHVLLTVSWLAGLIPAAVLLGLYLWRVGVPGPDNPAGRAMVGLLGVTNATYLLSVLVLVAPGLFVGDGGQVLRVGSRLAVAAVLWNLLRLFLLAQRAGRIERKGRHGDIP